MATRKFAFFDTEEHSCGDTMIDEWADVALNCYFNYYDSDPSFDDDFCIDGDCGLTDGTETFIIYPSWREAFGDSLIDATDLVDWDVSEDYFQSVESPLITTLDLKYEDDEERAERLPMPFSDWMDQDWDVRLDWYENNDPDYEDELDSYYDYWLTPDADDWKTLRDAVKNLIAHNGYLASLDEVEEDLSDFTPAITAPGKYTKEFVNVIDDTVGGWIQHEFAMSEERVEEIYPYITYIINDKGIISINPTEDFWTVVSPTSKTGQLIVQSLADSGKPSQFDYELDVAISQLDARQSGVDIDDIIA